MNIVIFMAIGCQNLWDELILKNEMALLRKKYAWNTIKFQVFSYDIHHLFLTGDDIEYYEYFPIGMKNPRNIWRNLKNYFTFIKVLKKASKVVFGGGGIIFDYETGNYSNPLKQILFRKKICEVMKKEVIFWGVSIDIKHRYNDITVRDIFSNAKEIYVRDESSKNYLAGLGILAEQILDPVFYDNGEEGIRNFETNFMQKKIATEDFTLESLNEFDFTGKKVGMALRNWYLSDETIQKLVDFLHQKWAKIVFLPHSFHAVDEHANDYLFLNGFLGKIDEIASDMKQTYECYTHKKIDFCISMRLHSMILSQVYGIPFVSLKYAKKADLM